MQAPNRVVLVFVNEEGVAYNHRWEAEHGERPGFPADLEGRFQQQALP